MIFENFFKGGNGVIQKDVQNDVFLYPNLSFPFVRTFIRPFVRTLLRPFKRTFYVLLYVQLYVRFFKWTAPELVCLFSFRRF